MQIADRHLICLGITFHLSIINEFNKFTWLISALGLMGKGGENRELSKGWEEFLGALYEVEERSQLACNPLCPPAAKQGERRLWISCRARPLLFSGLVRMFRLLLILIYLFLLVATDF